MANVDARLDVKVLDNMLKVIANFVPAQGDGQNMSVEDVLSTLESMGIRTVINNDVIQNMSKSSKPLINVVLAEAIPPQVGDKARIEPYFEINKRRMVIEKGNGRVDYHDLGEISSAKKGKELFRKIPPTIGKQGVDVLGNEIPGVSGRDLKIVLGSGTEFDENDPDLVRASYDGEIIVKDGIVQISKVHKVEGDVDYSTGNIIFNGSIKINGTVKAGFKVEADGNIEINGNVEDAFIIGGNDIIINGGYAGNGEGIVQAKHDIYVKFIENQTVEADRDIIVSGHSYLARLRAGRSIIAKGEKGIIVGGENEAKVSIEAMRIGSAACPQTKIKVGFHPKLSEKIKKVEEEIKQMEDYGEKLEKDMDFIYKQKIDSYGQLPPDKQALLEKLEKEEKSLPQKLKMLQTTFDSLIKEQERGDLENSYISADFAVFPQVQIYIGNQLITVEDELGPSRFEMHNGEVVRFSK